MYAIRSYYEQAEHTAHGEVQLAARLHGPTRRRRLVEQRDEEAVPPRLREHALASVIECEDAF